MTLTVRLAPPLDQALDAYCAAHGLTKSQVVQESLAAYLIRSEAQPAAKRKGVSANYAHFKREGWIGCATGEGVSATKAVVRERVLSQLKSRR
jgi:hypothetical protein